MSKNNYLEVTKLNGTATFQDLGRDHAQHLGFSGSGAADEYSYRLANFLLANPSNAPALEITLGQISITAHAACRFVLTGADCNAIIVCADAEQLATHDHSQQAHRRQIINNKVYQLAQGEMLLLTMPQQQLITYLAVQGGFLCQKWLNSASQASNEFNLAFGEPAVKVGRQLDFTELAPAISQKPSDQGRYHFHQSGHLILRFLPSVLWQELTLIRQTQFLDQHYHISPRSNRMGYRLQGSPLLVEDTQLALSKPVSYGAIQCPSDGQPIVLMKDRQTIGGYPVLGNVIQVDLFRLSQKRPGETVSFLPISLAQAQAQLFAFQQKFEQ